MFYKIVILLSAIPIKVFFLFFFVSVFFIICSPSIKSYIAFYELYSEVVKKAGAFNMQRDYLKKRSESHHFESNGTIGKCSNRDIFDFYFLSFYMTAACNSLFYIVLCSL